MIKITEIFDSPIGKDAHDIRVLLSVYGVVGGHDDFKPTKTIDEIFEQIAQLLNGTNNSNGDLYKLYYNDKLKSEDFDKFPFIVGRDLNIDWANPPGNNLLLLAISRSASEYTQFKPHVSRLVKLMISDAEAKLSPGDFKNFIDFTFVNIPEINHIIYDYPEYSNTPLTLAIKSGLYDMAHMLIDSGCNVLGISNAGYTSAHILAIKMPFSTSLDKEVQLLDRIIRQDKSLLEVKDIYNRTVADLLKMKEKIMSEVKQIRKSGSVEFLSLDEIKASTNPNDPGYDLLQNEEQDNATKIDLLLSLNPPSFFKNRVYNPEVFKGTDRNVLNYDESLNKNKIQACDWWCGEGGSLKESDCYPLAAFHGTDEYLHILQFIELAGATD